MGMRNWSWKRWTVIGVVAVVALVVLVPFLLFNVIEKKAPAPLGASPAANASQTATTSAIAPAANATLDGQWKVSAGSEAGYRVKEVLFGRDNEAVGRTSAVTGGITVTGVTIPAGSFSVDLTTVKSDQSRRDAQFQGRIMNTAAFPAATFVLTSPIDLGSVPAVGAEVSAKAPGRLTLHGVTRPTVVDVKARRSASGITVTGSIPVKFEDWSITNPSIGPITTEDHGLLEFALVLTHA